MTRIAFCADLHAANHRAFGGDWRAGLNDRARDCIDVLRRAVEMARQERCMSLVFCGDLFDGVRPEPQLIAAVQDAFCHEGLPVVVLVGNHDLRSTAKGDHALGPLGRIEGIEVADAPRLHHDGDVTVACVPWRPGPAAEWLAAGVEELFGGAAQDAVAMRVLAAHVGVSDAETAPDLAAAQDAVPRKLVRALCAEFGLVAAICGHWHAGKRWTERDAGVKRATSIVQRLGCLCPTGFDDAGESVGTLAVLDSGDGSVREIEIPGPRFLTACGVADANKLLPPAPGVSGVVRHRRQAAQDAPGPSLGAGPGGNGGRAAKASLGAVQALPGGGAGEGRLAPYLRLVVGPGEVGEANERLAAWRAEGRVRDGVVEVDSREAQAAARTAAAAARSRQTLDEALAAYVREMSLDDSVHRAGVLALVRRYLDAEGGA